MHSEFLFFFLRAGGLARVLEARGVGVVVEPEIGSEALKIDVASPLTVQVLNISVCLYTIYICRLTPILR